MTDLYDIEPYDGEPDYISEVGLERIAELLTRLPAGGFDLKSSQAHTSSVTATLAFEGIEGPMAQQETLVAVLRSATVVRTLHANLVAARAALAACQEPPA